MARAIVLLLLAFLLGVSEASRGDRLPYFTSCVTTCVDTYGGGDANANHMLPWNLRLLGWTCGSECDYQCQRSTIELLTRSDLPEEQFHGKWYFIRAWPGIQEPASVLFSLLNFAAHVYGLRLLKRDMPTEWPLRTACLLFSYTGLNAWFWSAVFHSRDTARTERADYFAAATTVVYSAYFSLVRVARLDRARFTRLHSAWASFCGLALVSHIVYQSTRPSFHYTHNMIFNVAWGAVQNSIWYYFSITSYLAAGSVGTNVDATWCLWPAYACTLVTVAMSLELFDFSPIAHVLDAHALWHMSTAPIYVFWYWFMIRDAKHNVILAKKMHA